MAVQARVVLRRRDRDAAFFDMDGVLTDTVRLHIDAWKRLFDDFLRRQAAASGEAFVPFDTRADYLAYVDGRPREDGVRLFLASRGIKLPEGAERDPWDAETVAALSRRKDLMFLQALQAGADPLPGRKICCGNCGVLASGPPSSPPAGTPLPRWRPPASPHMWMSGWTSWTR